MFQDRVSGRAVKLRALFAVGIALVLASGAVAQTPVGPRPAPPPSYGPPVSPLLAGYEMSQFSSGFNFTFTVALTEIQKFLPAGYTPIPSAPGATTTTVTAIFGYRTLLTLTTPIGGFAAGTYGPFETFDLAVGAFPPPGSPTAFESVFIARFVNNAEIAEIRTALGGPNETRLADITVRVTEGLGILQMKGKVEDFDFGLRVVATQTGPAEIVNQLRQSGPLALRVVDTLVSPPTLGAVGFVGVSADNPAPIADPAGLDVAASRVRLAGGRMKILGAAPGSFFLNQEVFFKRN